MVRQRWLWLGTLLLGAGLRFLWLGRKSLWLDEAFSLWVAAQPWGELWAQLITLDQHPPLYYALLRVWISSMGQSEAGLRSLSALAGVLTLPLFYATARRLLDAPTAGLALLLLAVSPFHLAYAQEARMYAWLGLAGAGAMLALAVLAQAGWPGWRKARGWWLLLVLAEALALWLHNSALLLPVALSGAALALGAPRRGWAVSQLMVLLLWLPWLPGFLAQAASVADGFWIAPPTGATVMDTFTNFGLAFLPGWLPQAWLWALLPAGLALWGGMDLVRRPASRPVGLALLVLLLLPVLGQLAASLIRPIYGDRTMLWAGLPFLLLTAQGVRALGRPHLRLAGVGILLILTALALHNYYANAPKEAWRDAAAITAARVQPGEVLLFNAGWTQIPFDYYFERTPQAESVPRFGLPVDPFERGELEPVMAEADLPRLRTLILGRPGVWLVYSHDAYTDPEGLISSALAREMTLAEEWSFVGIRLLRFASQD